MRAVRAARIAAAAIGTASFLSLTFTASASGPIRFSFRGYAHDVRVIEPLVGPWQLGVARINGSGSLTPTEISGDIYDTFQPMYSQYSPASMHARVIGYRYYRAAHGAYTNLVLAIQIVDTDAPQCATGDQGTLTLHESAHRLRNHQRSDSIVMRWENQRCPGFVQGWDNSNGGARESPPFGGPPHGGRWAIVKIS